MREPQRERGRARVAALLAAAGTVFDDKGFDAATMTEIARRAGASIGSLYQFFPTKELLAEALIGHYADALHARLAALEAVAAALDADTLARRLLPLLVEFRVDHPAFAALAEAPGAQAVRGGAIRARLRRQIQAILRRQAPDLPEERAEPLAVAVLQVMKAAVALNTEPGLAVRDAALDELTLMLRRHLAMQLGAQRKDSTAL